MHLTVVQASSKSVPDDKEGKCQTPNSIYGSVNIFMHFSLQMHIVEMGNAKNTGWTVNHNSE